MDYQDAKNLREKRLRDLLADSLISGDTINEFYNKVLLPKTEAEIKGVKERFDLLNIAKFMTGGSKLAPALMGRLTGRSQEDIGYFTDEPKKKITSIQKNDVPIISILDKIYTFMNKSHLDNIKRSELENNYLEEKALEEKKRHDLLLQTLKNLMKRIASSQKGVMKESEPESESSNGLKDAIKGFLEKRIGRIIAGGAAGIAGKKALEKGAEKAIGKTAEKVTGAVGKEVAEKGAEKAVQKTAEKVTGEVAKKVAEKGAEEVAEQGIKSKIEKVVSGKLTKFIFSSGAKKVPIAGAIIGAIFGVKKLFEGDTVGAGMEVASGAAGTIPIAGTAASLGIDAAGLARDVYKEVFGKFPEEEPELAKQRMTLIANIIEDQIKSKSSPDKETENQEKKTSNQVTPANTSDAKSSNTTTPLSTSDSKSSNTTTPANTSDAKSSNTTTPANTSDAKSSNTTTPLSTTKSTSTNTKRVSAPESNSSDTSYKLADVTAKVPVGKTLQELLDENQNLNIEESTTKNTQVKPNQINISSPATQDKSGLIIEKYIHPVRNQEVTFRNMIFNSTRVV